MRAYKHPVIFLAILITILASSCSSVALPEAPGTYHIGVYSISYNVSDYGTYQAEIRYPAICDGELAPRDKSDAPYPGIVVSSGYGGGEWSINWISENLTSHGYITLGFTPPDMFSNSTTQWAAGFIGGIEQLKIQNQNVSSPFYGLLDTSKFGAIGLSMGGAGCIEAAGTTDSEIDAVVALAPAGYNSSTNTSSMLAANNVSIPIQLQVGSEDSIVPPESVLPFYTNLIPNGTVKEFIEIRGGNHIGFLNWNFAEIASYLEIEPNASVGFEEQRRIANHYFTAWFQYYLKGLGGYSHYIFGKGAEESNVSVLDCNIP